MKILPKATPPTQQPTKNNNTQDQKRNALFIVLLGLLMIGGFVWWLIETNPEFFQTSNLSEKNNDSILATTLPVWIAISLPFIISKKKLAQLKTQAADQTLTPEKIRMISTLIIGIVVAIFIFVFLILVMSK